MPLDDIEHYYVTAPIIIEGIEKNKEKEKIYDYIYQQIVIPCVDAIEKGNYDYAYTKYKNSVLILEKNFARPVLNKKLIKTLKLYNKN